MFQKRGSVIEVMGNMAYGLLCLGHGKGLRILLPQNSVWYGLLYEFHSVHLCFIIQFVVVYIHSMQSECFIVCVIVSSCEYM